MAREKRKSISKELAIDSMLYRVFLQFGKYLACSISGEDMKPGDAIQFDHTHCVALDGPHVYQNLRPVLKKPHQKKTKADLRMIKKTRPKHTETFVVNKPPPSRPRLCEEGGTSPCVCGAVEIYGVVVDCDRITPKRKIPSRKFPPPGSRPMRTGRAARKIGELK